VSVCGDEGELLGSGSVCVCILVCFELCVCVCVCVLREPGCVCVCFVISRDADALSAECVRTRVLTFPIFHKFNFSHSPHNKMLKQTLSAAIHQKTGLSKKLNKNTFSSIFSIFLFDFLNEKVGTNTLESEKRLQDFG